MNSETRAFQVSKHMIFHTIENQAGSIEKAMLECLMNAVDAGASEVHISLNENGKYSIRDNGKGFQTKEEIYNCFEVFGFDHGTAEENHRTYGTFGIGRAQLWAFSKNVWHTNEFSLDVDIKNKGLDYILSENNSPVKGCLIEGEFYDKPSLVDLQNIQRELIKLALYLPISFYLNDKKVNKELSSEKWDYETEEAYIKLTETGDLRIYNLGVFVCSYPNYRFGKGGVILSKKSLSLNTARNDILLSKCNVWKGIKKYVEEKSTSDNLKKTSLSNEQKKNLVFKWVSGELSYNDLLGKRILPDIKGKSNVLSSLLKNGAVITICPTKGSQIGENIHNSKLAFVFPPEIKDWFDIETAEELSYKITKLMIRDRAIYSQNRGLKYKEFEEFKKEFNSDKAYIETSKYTKKQKASMKIVEKMAYEIPKIINEIRHWDRDNILQERSVKLGVSESAWAWTDSSTFIAIDKDFLMDKISYGMGGIVQIVNVMIHEYLHDKPSIEDHIHSHEFFEEYHDILTNTHKFFYLYKDCMLMYIRELIKLDLSVPRQFVRDESVMIEVEKTLEIA